MNNQKENTMLITQTKDTTIGDFVEQLNQHNIEDAEWTLEYAAPGFVFTTADAQLETMARDIAQHNNMLIGEEA